MTQAEFEHIAAHVRPLMLDVGMNFFASRQDAEDVAQEALLRLWRCCERIDAGRNIEALAVRVAKSCCVDMYRRRHAGALAVREQTLAASPHEKMEEDEAQRMLHAALAKLKPRERSLFEMRQIEGLSNDEIADQTGIAKSSVKAMVSVARRKVFEELKKTFGL